MAIKKEVWVCEVCAKSHDDEQAANLCAKLHADIEKAVIKHPVYEAKQRIPSSIQIKFSNDHGDFAKYVLSHIGHVRI